MAALAMVHVCRWQLCCQLCWQHLKAVLAESLLRHSAALCHVCQLCCQHLEAVLACPGSLRGHQSCLCCCLGQSLGPFDHLKCRQKHLIAWPAGGWPACCRGMDAVDLPLGRYSKSHAFKSVLCMSMIPQSYLLPTCGRCGGCQVARD
jgi:hypothetical protein